MKNETRFVRISNDIGGGRSGFVRIEQCKTRGSYIFVCDDGINEKSLWIDDDQMDNLYRAIDVYLNGPSGEMFLGFDKD